MNLHLAEISRYEAIVDACYDAWNALAAAPETIRPITSRALAAALTT